VLKQIKREGAPPLCALWAEYREAIRSTNAERPGPASAGITGEECAMKVYKVPLAAGAAAGGWVYCDQSGPPGVVTEGGQWPRRWPCRRGLGAGLEDYEAEACPA